MFTGQSQQPLASGPPSSVLRPNQLQSNPHAPAQAAVYPPSADPSSGVAAELAGARFVGSNAKSALYESPQLVSAGVGVMPLPDRALRLVPIQQAADTRVRELWAVPATAEEVDESAPTPLDLKAYARELKSHQQRFEKKIYQSIVESGADEIVALDTKGWSKDETTQEWGHR